MLRILKTANLPASQVKLCAIGEGNGETKKELIRLGIKTISPKACRTLIKAEQTHADMLMLHLGGEKIFLSHGQDMLKARLEALGFSVTLLSVPLESEYPFNVTLNAAIIGEKFFAHKNTVKLFSRHVGFDFYTVKQGYSKCSSCVVSENAVITEDENIYSAMKSAGLDVLKIKKGETALKGINYGFFGGASGKLSPNILAINGELSYNSDKDAIVSFLKNYGIDIICLKSGLLEDIGGILPLLEEDNNV